MQEQQNSPSREQLVKEAQRLAEGVYNYVGGESGGEGGMSWEEKKRMMAERWREAQERSKQAGRKVDSYAHENVWASVGIAAALGALVGMVIRKGSSRRDRG